jgi:hypothetical protein
MVYYEIKRLIIEFSRQDLIILNRENKFMNKKNYLLGAVLLTAFYSLCPYDATIVNSTDGNIVVYVERARPDICAPLVTILGSNRQRTVNTGACCLGDLKIKKTSGSNIGATFTYQPPFTNSNYTCASVAIKVTDDLTNKRIKAEAI